MTNVPIRYRFDGPGPAALLVEIDGLLHMCTHGEVGEAMTSGRATALVAGRGSRWVPCGGTVLVADASAKDDIARDLPIPPPTPAVETAAGAF